MKKRILSVFMALCLTLTLIPAASASETTGEDQTPAAAGDTTTSPDGAPSSTETPDLTETPETTGTPETTVPTNEPTEETGSDTSTGDEGNEETGPVVAMFSGQEFSSLEAAIKAAESYPSGIIDLVDNATMAEGVVINNNITINGNDYTVTGQADNPNVNILVNNGSLTISDVTLKDFGGATGTVGQWGLIKMSNTGGNLTVNNVTFENFNRAAIDIRGGRFTITDCTIDCANDSAAKLTKGVLVENASGTISNTTITNTENTYADWNTNAIETWGDVDVTVTGCALGDTGEEVINGISMNAGTGTSTVDVSNTTIVADTRIFKLTPDASGTGTATLNVDSGNYTGTFRVNQGSVQGKGCTIRVTGGTYTDNPSNPEAMDEGEYPQSFVPTGYTVTGEGPFTVTASEGMEAEVTKPESGETTSSANVGGSFKPNTNSGNVDGGSVEAGSNTVTINVATGDSGDANDAVTSTTVSVDTNSVSSLAKNNVSATLVTDVADLEIPAAAWESMAAAAKGSDVVLSVEENQSEGQVTGWEITATADSNPVFTGADDSTITVTVPYTLEEGKAGVKVYCTDNGGMEPMANVIYTPGSGDAAGTLSWDTTHFSNFAPATLSETEKVQYQTAGGEIQSAETLKAALEAVKDTGGTIVVQGDLTEGAFSVQLSKDVTIDLNGHKVTLTPGGGDLEYPDSAFVLWDSNTLTIKDSAGTGSLTISGNEKGVAFDLLIGTGVVIDGADVTVSGLSMGVRMAGTDVGADRTLRVINGGSLTGTGLTGNFTNTNINQGGTEEGDSSGKINSGLNVTVSGDSTITVTASNGSTSNGLSVKNLTVEDGGKVSVSGAGRYGVTATDDIKVTGTGSTLIVTGCGGEATTNGAGVRVQTGDVTVTDGAAMSVAGTNNKLAIGEDSKVTTTGGSLTSGGLVLPETSECVVVQYLLNGQLYWTDTFTIDGEEPTGPVTYTEPTVTSLPADTKFNGWTYGGIDVTVSNGTASFTATKGETYTFTGTTTTYTPPVNPDPPTTITPGGSTGGSSSSSSGNLVTVDRTTGGTVQVRPGRAESGDTVTITATPNEGYEVESVTVTDSRGNEISVRSAGNDRYTFTMPNSKVDIDVNFVRIGGQQPAPQTGFRDVSAAAYYYDAVQWAVEQGITTGTTATTFNPNGGCTRAQIVTFLWRANGSPAPRTTTNPFTDVSANAYYYDAVLWAVEQGITSGTTATTFGPNSGCTRAQAATFLWRSEGSPAAGGSSFSDVADGAYYAGAVDWAVANGVTQGTTSTTFSPNTACTRAQIVTFLYRALA